MSVIHNHTVPKSETSSFSLRLPHVTTRTLEQAEAIHTLSKDFPELLGMSDNKERRDFIDSKRKEWVRRIDILSKEKLESIRKLEAFREKEVAIQEMLETCKKSLVIEKPDGPSFRRLRRAVAEGRAIDLMPNVDSVVPAHDFEKEVFRFAEILVVEHDWASAFASTDLDDAEVRLPYDVCAFEFKFSGQAVIAIATQMDTKVFVCVTVEHSDKWIVPDFVVTVNSYEEDESGLLNLFNVVCAQIRAICIALDAEVARSDTVREPHTGQRNNSYQEPRPYHVVSLARRQARPLQHSGATGRRVRLHFRRGHWRHFEAHKTWIRWMLVGDPDLGFVEKHYRL